MRSFAQWIPARMHYACVVAAVICLVLLVSAGLRAATSVLIIPLEQAFGWTREVISAPLSVGLLLFGLMGPFAAALMQRFGVRVTVSASLALMASGAGLSLFMTEPWHLMATWGAMVGVAAGALAVVLGAVIVNRWFAVHRGLVFGIFTASTAAGQLVFLPVLAWLAQNGGWRPVSWACALAAAVLVPVVLFLLPERPRDVGLLPLGATIAERPVPQPGNPVAAAFRSLAAAVTTRDFWLLGGTFLVCGMTTNGLIGTHLIPMCFEAGVPQVMAAGLLATIGVFNVAGATFSGWLSDRWDSRRLLFCYYTLRGVSLLFLPTTDFTVGALTVFSVVYGLDWIATGPPTLRLTNDLYGKHEGPILFGWIVAMHQVGSALAAWGGGTMRVHFGSYNEAFFIAGTACFVGALMALAIGRPQRPVFSPAMG